ncbi:conserved hypothetical protein [Verticillium alfalfae VaMs.102]|uniref:Uncharacterized protein n=1 Tax=Verticillium alfalfae (strain VaMs.102 / ATCC MYA-4576 / FGSC 10136) TaxID=526221 RepID=C9SM83_VERA1|nr:conserved hypothetical protein [Verticillium alfalfae VaMs.102]EEY19898.1 conserved hypothetical protein [Verticillium alfalfae VaMs.102]
MELNPETIDTVIHPTAVLKRTTVPPSQPRLKALLPVPADIAWDLSQLNPKNRIDSLAPLVTPYWRIDGCTSWGSQYYATPLFMASVPPMRIDVFVPDLSLQTRLVRDLLELDQAFHTKDRVRVSRLSVSMHILRRLQIWTMTIGGADQEFINGDGPRRRRTHSERFEYAEKYLCHLPFGSRIVFDSLSLDINQINITVVPTFALEVYHFSVRQFEAAWGHDVTLPPCVNITQVQLVEQIHDSTSIVRIDGQSYIFKALTSFPKYLYHELRILLTTKPHPNIMSRPVHLVTKRTRFGGKNAVLGFTLELHRHEMPSWSTFEQRGVCVASVRHKKHLSGSPIVGESHLQFPEYHRTPPRLRQLIDECTKGRRETLDNQILRVGNKLVLRADLEANVDTNPEVLIKVARDWWEKEVGWAEKYLVDREAKKQNGTWDDNPYDRPTIRQVLQSPGIHSYRDHGVVMGQEAEIWHTINAVTSTLKGSP